MIRGECYDRQFMFGKGAGSLPTASSILSDIMARQHDYRYEYKKQHYLDRPEYTTDVELKVYVRYTETDVLKILHFDRITEQYRGEDGNYVIGYIRLSELLAKREVLRGRTFSWPISRASSKSWIVRAKDRPPSNERLPNFRFGRRSFFRATNYLLERDHRLRRIVIGIGEDISPTLFRLTTVTPQILEYIIIIDRRVVMCVVIRRVRPTVVLVITDTISESKPPIVENNRHFPNVT